MTRERCRRISIGVTQAADDPVRPQWPALCSTRDFFNRDIHPPQQFDCQVPGTRRLMLSPCSGFGARQANTLRITNKGQPEADIRPRRIYCNSPRLQPGRDHACDPWESAFAAAASR